MVQGEMSTPQLYLLLPPPPGHQLCCNDFFCSLSRAPMTRPHTQTDCTPACQVKRSSRVIEHVRLRHRRWRIGAGGEKGGRGKQLRFFCNVRYFSILPSRQRDCYVTSRHTFGWLLRDITCNSISLVLRDTALIRHGKCLRNIPGFFK